MIDVRRQHESARAAPACGAAAGHRGKDPSPARAFVARVSSWLARVAWALLSLGFFAGLWEIAWGLGLTNPTLLPPPHVFLGSFLDQAKFFSPALRWSVGADPAELPSPTISVLMTMAATSARVLAGLTLATILAVSLGIGIRRYIFVERLTLPTVQFLAPVSPIAWLPVAVFMFGIGNPRPSSWCSSRCSSR